MLMVLQISTIEKRIDSLEVPEELLQSTFYESSLIVLMFSTKRTRKERFSTIWILRYRQW